MMPLHLPDGAVASVEIAGTFECFAAAPRGLASEEQAKDLIKFHFPCSTIVPVRSVLPRPFRT
jgi:hypothetical protein